jgi:hypothetical protein
MATISYERESTALLVIDPYNDFISEGGKIWDRMSRLPLGLRNFKSTALVAVAIRDLMSTRPS